MILADYVANLDFFTSMDGFGIVVSIVAIVAGIIFGLFGSKLYKAFIYISGFIFGYTAGSWLVGLFELNQLIEFIIKLALGVLGFVLLWKLLRIGIFISTGTLGFLVLYTLTGNLYVALAAFVIAGVLGLLLQKPIVIISTSLSGGFSVAAGAVSLILTACNLDMSTVLSIAYLIVGVLLSIVFIGAQFKNKKD